MIDIVSKQWNPYVKDGRDIFVSKIDFAVASTEKGAVTIDYFASSGDLSTLNTAVGTGTLLGTGDYLQLHIQQYVVKTLQPCCGILCICKMKGNLIQIRISYSDLQMLDIDIVDSNFELQGIILHCMPTASRLE